jgi:hypothetical protein
MILILMILIFRVFWWKLLRLTTKTRRKRPKFVIVFWTLDMEFKKWKIICCSSVFAFELWGCVDICFFACFLWQFCVDNVDKWLRFFTVALQDVHASLTICFQFHTFKYHS